MSNAFSSAVFLFRNGEKVNSGDIGRAPVVVAQAGSLVNKVSLIDSQIGKTTKTAIDALDKTSKAGFGSKAMTVAGDWVNPLILASAGIKVLTSDDKEKALYEEGGGMAGMFAAEGFLKKSGVKSYIKSNSDNVIERAITKLGKYIKPLEEASEKSKNKFVKAASFIISGTVFVLGSIFGYDVGKGIGHDAIETKRESNTVKQPVHKTAKANDESAENGNFFTKS